MDYINLLGEVIINNWAVITAFILIFLATYKPSKHFFKVRSANRTLRRITSFQNPAKLFIYLRKVDPFVFEEMILSSLKKQGHKIRRNKRYTGDGGIDGRAWINGQKVFIQAKRYKSHISAQDVSKFASICAKSNSKGLFVHTGKTGKQSYKNSGAGLVDIVSGERMLNLLIGQSFSPRWRS